MKKGIKSDTPIWKYLLSDLDFDEEEKRAVADVIDSKWLSMGQKTRDFENRFSRYAEVPFALATANCTSALHLGLAALGIGKGDEVIVPSMTFVASSNAILYTGATPVFADISSLKNPVIDPDDLEKKITKRTKAVIVMHYAGYPCRMDRITSIAKKRGLFIIEDAAHAVGSYFHGKMCGTIGDIGCFSFFANKNLAVGEGGMLVTRQEKIKEKVLKLRSHGMTSLTWDRVRGHSFSYDVVDLGYNYRTTEINAAIGIVQLQKLNRNNKKKNQLFRDYVKRLSGITGLEVPFSDRDPNEIYCRHLFPVVLDNNVQRQAFMSSLKGSGIQTSIHYPPIHSFTYYKKNMRRHQAVSLAKTEEFGRRVVTLPMHPLLDKYAITEICDCIKAFFGTK